MNSIWYYNLFILCPVIFMSIDSYIVPWVGCSFEISHGCRLIVSSILVIKVIHYAKHDFSYCSPHDWFRSPVNVMLFSNNNLPRSRIRSYYFPFNPYIKTFDVRSVSLNMSLFYDNPGLCSFNDWETHESFCVVRSEGYSVPNFFLHHALFNHR